MPLNAPSEFQDRSVLWNSVEKIEKAKNSQLAREIEVALPVELSSDEQIKLAREYCQSQFVSKGMCADICIHDKGDGNPHAHIMLTMRPLTEEKVWGAKSKKEYVLDENGERIRLKSGEFKSIKIPAVDWNDQSNAEEWRKAWADEVNAFLLCRNIREKVDHRSYERQGIEQIPTVHLGVAANQMEKRGIKTDRGNINRKAEVTNKELRQLKARINKLKNWLESVPQNTAPALSDIIQNMLNNRNYSNPNQKFIDLKNAAKLVNFLQENNINSLEQLQEKVTEINNNFFTVKNELKPIERRLKAHDEHIQQSEIY